jgi:hypothetical protein
VSRPDILVVIPLPAATVEALRAEYTVQALIANLAAHFSGQPLRSPVPPA